jgi:hypothetical protein
MAAWALCTYCTLSERIYARPHPLGAARFPITFSTLSFKKLFLCQLAGYIIWAMKRQAVGLCAFGICILATVSQPQSTTTGTQGATAPTSSTIWTWTPGARTSTTRSRDYKVKIDGEYISAEWVKPADLESQFPEASERIELKKSGDVWVGTKTAYFPVLRFGGYKYCSATTRVEITSVTASRLEGRWESWTKFDNAKCQPIDINWRDFTFMPKN